MMFRADDHQHRCLRVELHLVRLDIGLGSLRQVAVGSEAGGVCGEYLDQGLLQEGSIEFIRDVIKNRGSDEPRTCVFDVS